MDLEIINTGNFKLDGGAMFGVVPKVLWSKDYPADENNHINLTMRSMLIVDEGKKILIDNGIGDKQDEKFFSHYHLNGEDSLINSLENAGYKPSEITDVIMTHLHFDHCGGGVYYNTKGELSLTFPNATYHTSKAQWDTFKNPNAIEKASMLKENLQPIEDSGQLRLIRDDVQLTANIRLRLFSGHTKGQVIPFINYKGKTLVYVADLLPTMGNIPMAWITAYDVEPLVVFEEKKRFLDEALKNEYVLFFEHDYYNECCTLKLTPKGIRVDKKFNLEELKVS